MKRMHNIISRITLALMGEGRGVGLLLITLVMMAMSPTRVWAETQFISEIAISTNSNGSTAKNNLTSNGYTIVTGDINNGTGGNWAYLGVKYTTDPSKGITGIMICKGGGERQDKMVEGYTDGGYVTIVDDTYSDRKWYRCKSYGDCNIDNKGDGLTVYYTRYGIKSALPLVTTLGEVGNTSMTGVTYVKLWTGTSNDGTNYQGKLTEDFAADCNKGAGSNTPYIYLWYTTHSHTLKDVDCGDYAYHDYRCTACEYIHQHNVHNTPQQDVSATFLLSAATCTEAAVYYHKCKYCGGKMSSTYTYGSALGHSYTNGVCTKTPNQTHYEPCSGSGTSADPYLISNNGNLMWFSDVTNGYSGLTRNLSAQGKLTTDLDMSGLTFTSIGLYSDTKSPSTYFTGVFDGQGHVISNLSVTAPETYEAGFVSRLQGTVQNLILKKVAITATPYVSARIGGIAGLTHTNAVISCCGVIDATLSNPNDKTVQLGGIVGGYSTGSIAYTFTDHNKFFGVGDLSIHTNCFENVSSAWKTSGELCWRLNGGAVTGQVWHQNLSGTSIDAYPIPTATNHSTVYMKYADKKVSFTNTSTSITADQTVSISTAAELNEVAHAIALGYSGKINVNQTADIDYTGYNTVNDMIGGDITNYGTGAIGSKVYKGTYDGQGHYIKVGFNFGEVRYVGLFRAVDGATIKRLHTTGSITTDELFCGGVVALVGNNRLSLQNVTSDVTITSTHTTDVGNGGLVGYSKVGTNYTNCAFYGKFVGASATTPYWGGLSGRADANDLLTNCYVAFTTENIKSSTYNYTFSSKIDSNSKNYYRLNSLGTDQGTAKTADQFKSGEVCFLLNNGAVSDQAWHQTLNTDSYPLLNNTRGTVYITLDKDCEFVYTNTAYADQTLSFEVGTAAKLNNVARLHANGFTGKVDVTLTDDIDYTAYKTVYDMIGCFDARPYKGTFNGQGHSLTVDITHGENYVGPFRSIDGATIKNLHLKGSVTNTNYKFTGGVASHAINNASTLENVICDVQINCSLANDVSNGGLIAHVAVPVTITNCAYRGKFDGANSYAWGGFIGWLNAGQTATITNCYVALDSNSSYNSKNCATFVRQGGTLAGGNNYYYSLIGVDNWSDCSQFAAGKLCYLLNGSRSEGTEENPLAWYQTLTGTSTDAYPVLNSSHSTVYQNNNYYCDGATVKSNFYSNDANASNTDKHEYEAENNTTNGFCHGTPNQEHLQPAQLKNDYYQIGNAGQLYWFADKVNNENDTYKNAFAKLTADIVVNKGTFSADGTWSETGSPRAWTPIGKGEVDNTWYGYNGIFNGNGHTVSGLYFNNSSAKYAGLIGYNRGTITNVGVVDSYFKADMAGLVCGRNTAFIDDCYASGTVTGTETIGGICGLNTFNIWNCYATGTVTGTNEIGGICGYNSYTISSCYTNNDVAIGYNSGDTTNVEGGVTPERFNSGEITWKLNGSIDESGNWAIGPTDGTQAWYQVAGTGYPSLVKAADGSNTIYGMNRNYNNTGRLSLPMTNVDGTYYTSLSCDFPFTVEDADIYVATAAQEGVLTMTKTTDNVAVGEGVVLKGDTAIATLVYQTSATAQANNLLHGTTKEITDTAGKLVFAKTAGIIGFYKWTAQGKSIPAFKAYLNASELGSASESNGYRLAFEDMSTGLGSINNEQLIINNESGAIYNLQGQRLNAPQRGMNIINGKKVLVR